MSMMICRRLLLLGSILLVFLLLEPTPAVFAAPLGDKTGGGVVLTPSDASGNQILNPGYYEVTASPGQSETLYAFVGNIQQRTVPIDLAAVDAASGVYGGVSYNLPQKPRKHVGAWMSLSNRVFRLPSRKARVLTVRVAVPANAKPGQYVGGLTAYIPATQKGAVVVQLRRVLAVVVTVTGGPLFGRFKVGSVRPKHRPSGYFLITHIHNTGTILLKGSGHLWLWQQGHKKPIVSAGLSLDTTLPGTTVHYPVHWSRRPPAGSYTYKVSLSWPDGGPVLKRGTFKIP